MCEFSQRSKWRACWQRFGRGLACPSISGSCPLEIQRILADLAAACAAKEGSVALHQWPGRSLSEECHVLRRRCTRG